TALRDEGQPDAGAGVPRRRSRRRTGRGLGRRTAVALDSGMAPEHVSFAGPGKSDAELAQAVAAGILVNVESFREIGVLARAGERLGLKPRVAVRVNLPFELKASGMKMSGGARQFGVDAELVPELLREIAVAGLGFE